ncbi:MAG TPA: glutamate dehydrogenase, partial [Telluria sp.]
DDRSGVGSMEELACLFARPGMLEQLTAADPGAEAIPALPASFIQAWRSVDAIEALAAFLFVAVALRRPAGMTLARFVHVGMALRDQAGIGTLERGLKLVPHSKPQEQLRNYAMQALRRTQQRLLMQVVARLSEGSDLPAVMAGLTGSMGLKRYAAPIGQEQAVLDTWAISEAVRG